jgi:hypothetical protein
MCARHGYGLNPYAFRTLQEGSRDGSAVLHQGRFPKGGPDRRHIFAIVNTSFLGDLLPTASLPGLQPTSRAQAT